MRYARSHKNLQIPAFFKTDRTGEKGASQTASTGNVISNRLPKMVLQPMSAKPKTWPEPHDFASLETTDRSKAFFFQIDLYECFTSLFKRSFFPKTGIRF